MEPASDAAIPAAGPVMILDALAPLRPERRIGRPGQDHRILARDHRLVAKAVERPGLHLALGQRAFRHAVVKGVAVVVALRADRAKHLLQPAPLQPAARGIEEIGHSAISMPSWAISQPACRTAACSGEVSSSTGLLLLMWMKTFRPTATSAKAATEPCGPDIARCPIRAPVLVPRPAAIISSSV